MKRLLKIFNLLRFLYAINGAVVGLILGILGNYLSGSGSLITLPYLFPIFLLLDLLILYSELKRRKLINVSLKIITARNEYEKKQFSRKGIISFVSLYDARFSPIAKNLSQEQKEEAARKRDYHTLDLENTNMRPVIEAICSHKDAPLEHCWLIGTTEVETGKGSTMYQDVLVEFLKKEKGIRSKFHYGEGYSIPIQDDALICEKTYNKIKEIFKEASLYGLEGKDLIADFTGGIRSMTAGMILSCLHSDSDVQLIGTKYDASAKPVGPLFPVYIAFEPEIETQR